MSKSFKSKSPLAYWKSLPEGLRRKVSLTSKAALTVASFYVLLTHQVEDPKGGSISIGAALASYVSTIKLDIFLPWAIAAAAVKFVGILCSMFRWHLLLDGQKVRFNFGHIFGSFLIGRFLGTFLPSTVGLDGYKLYDAARFSKKSVEVAAATVLEKAMGFAGNLLTVLVALPLGYVILYDVAGKNTYIVIAITLTIALGGITALFLTLFKAGLVRWGMNVLASFGLGRFRNIIERVSQAASAYAGKSRLLFSVLGLSFVVHFTTAVMYYFTALAVGVVDADFWAVTFASGIQIFATVLSPFTIGGEGVREAVHAFLLADHMGVSQAILSAALGFWAAEALTLGGAFFWWARKKDYKPKFLEVDGKVVHDSTENNPPMMRQNASPA